MTPIDLAKPQSEADLSIALIGDQSGGNTALAVIAMVLTVLVIALLLAWIGPHVEAWWDRVWAKANEPDDRFGGEL